MGVPDVTAVELKAEVPVLMAVVVTAHTVVEGTSIVEILEVHGVAGVHVVEVIVVAIVYIKWIISSWK